MFLFLNCFLYISREAIKTDMEIVKSIRHFGKLLSF